MIKIAHVRDLSKLKDYPTEVIELVHHHVTVLDTEYGENRVLMKMMEDIS